MGGVHSVVLTVTDNEGATDTDTQDVQVSDAVPTLYVAEEFYADCNNCSDGDLLSVKEPAWYDIDELKEIFDVCAQSDEDVCDCYEPFSVAFTRAERIEEQEAAYGLTIEEIQQAVESATTASMLSLGEEGFAGGGFPDYASQGLSPAQIENKIVESCLYHFLKKINPLFYYSSEVHLFRAKKRTGTRWR